MISVKSQYIDKIGFALLLDEMHTLNALALRVCIETGIRIGDVVALPRAALNGCTIRTVAQKTKKDVVAEVDAATASALRSASNGLWLFPSHRSASGHIVRQTVWRDVTRVARKLGLREHVTPHSARKFFAVEEYRKNGIEAAQARLQHDRVFTTFLYAFSDRLTADELASDADGAEAVRAAVTLEALIAALGGRARIERFLNDFIKKHKDRG